MRLVLISSLIVSAWFGLCGSAMAATAAEDITVVEPYVRAVPPGQPNSASFMTLKNTTDRDHAVVAATSPVSKVVELHTHTQVEGMMQMRRVAKIDVAAGAETKLQPGGLHVMLIGLQQELVPGEEISLTLVFEDGSEKPLRAPVRKLPMMMRGHEGGMQHGKDHQPAR